MSPGLVIARGANNTAHVGIVETTAANGAIILEEQIKEGAGVRIVARKFLPPTDKLLGYIDYAHGDSPSIRLPDATPGKFYAASLDTISNPKSGEPLTADSLPPGLQVQGDSGEITGTPTKEGLFKFMLRVRSGTGPEAVQAYRVRVASAASDVSASVHTTPGSQPQPDKVAESKPAKPGADAVQTAANSNQTVRDSPPKVELVAEGFTVWVTVTDTGGGVGRLVYSQNGTEIGDAAFPGSNSGPQPPITFDTEGTVKVIAYTADGKFASAPATVLLPTRTNLYIISVGISRYSDHSLDEGVRFARGDAEAVSKAFMQQQRPLGPFTSVNHKELLDADATGANIREALARSANMVQPEDTFILYLSGHGVTIDGRYYFIPSDAVYTNQPDLLSRSLSGDSLRDLLKQIRGFKTVIFLDSCGSGAYLPARDISISDKAAIERLLATISGVTVIAAAGTDQMALEGYQNHSVFTYALLEGLQSAYVDAAGYITVGSLANYIQRRVPEISMQMFGYRQVPLSSIQGFSFPIARRLVK
jgi:hypothetical protein